MDRLSLDQRSRNMSRIRSSETNPEIQVRQILRELGYVGYRLHRRDLPGRPDIVFVGRKLAIQVHGCFWHSHTCAEGRRRPKSNLAYWEPKLDGNKNRDRRNAALLRGAGWKLLVIWDCQLSKRKSVTQRLKKFLADI